MDQHPSKRSDTNKRGPNLLGSFVLGASIEAGLNVLWLKLVSKPIHLAELARSAVFSGIAVATVYQLSKTKPVKHLLELPDDSNRQPPPQPPQSDWVAKTQESSQNCHTQTFHNFR